MKDIQEIFQTLKQVTLTKAKILQQVVNNKKNLSIKKQQQVFDPSGKNRNQVNMIESMNRNKLNQLKQQLNTEQKLSMALKVLRRSQSEYRQQKMRKMEQKIEILNKIKQQQIKLLELSFTCHQNNGNHRLHQKLKDQAMLKQNKYETCQFKKSKQLSRLQSQRVQKQNQLTILEESIVKQKQQISKLSTGANKLLDNIFQVKQIIKAKDKEQKQLQFQLQKLQIENRKYKKQLITTKQNTSVRVLQTKIKQQQQISNKLKFMLTNDVDNLQQYMLDVHHIKQQLKI